MSPFSANGVAETTNSLIHQFSLNDDGSPKTTFNSKRGAELCIAALVSIANFCTANNTIAIITVGPLANDIATRNAVAIELQET